jgi:hypothetical protein
VVITDFMRWKVTTSFRPHLFATWQYWKTWFEMSAGVAKPAFMVSALIGFLTLRKKNVQALIVGLSFGYLIFCLIFNYHTITHPYYHIQLFPMIGVCAAPFIINIANMLKNSLNRYWVLPAIAIFLFGLYFSYSELRDGLYRTVIEDPSLASEIGEIVNHSTRTVVVAYHYGLPLEYYGEFSGAPWPVAIDDPFYRDPNEKVRSVQERLDSLGFQPEYFVITNFDLFNRKHQDLQSFLDRNCSVFAQTDHFLIYGSCTTNAFG